MHLADAYHARPRWVSECVCERKRREREKEKERKKERERWSALVCMYYLAYVRRCLDEMRCLGARAAEGDKHMLGERKA